MGGGQGDVQMPNPARFGPRMAKMKKALKWDFDALFLLHGTQIDDGQKNKIMALHSWLFGYEFPDTAIVVLRDGHVVVCATEKKTQLLRVALKFTDTTFITRPPKVKGLEPAQANELLTALRRLRTDPRSSFIVGLLEPQLQDSSFAVGVLKAVDGWDQVSTVNVDAGISTLLSTKDAEELDLHQGAGNIAAVLMRFRFLKKLELVIDTEMTTTHRALCDELEEAVENQEIDDELSKLGLLSDELELVDVAIQSGPNFDLRHGVKSTEDVIPMEGLFVLTIGVTYVDYCGFLTRTLLVNATSIQKDAYALAFHVQSIVISSLQPGKLFKEVYREAVNFVAKDHPQLLESFSKHVGWVTGLEFRDRELMLNEHSEQKVVAGMVFFVSIEFLVDHPKAKPWAIWISDTVAVLSDGPPQVLTGSCGKAAHDIMYDIANTDNETEVPVDAAAGSTVSQALTAVELPPPSNTSSVTAGVVVCTTETALTTTIPASETTTKTDMPTPAFEGESCAPKEVEVAEVAAVSPENVVAVPPETALEEGREVTVGLEVCSASATKTKADADEKRAEVMEKADVTPLQETGGTESRASEEAKEATKVVEVAEVVAVSREEVLQSEVGLEEGSASPTKTKADFGRGKARGKPGGRQRANVKASSRKTKADGVEKAEITPPQEMDSTESRAGEEPKEATKVVEVAEVVAVSREEVVPVVPEAAFEEWVHWEVGLEDGSASATKTKADIGRGKAKGKQGGRQRANVKASARKNKADGMEKAGITPPQEMDSIESRASKEPASATKTKADFERGKATGKQGGRQRTNVNAGARKKQVISSEAPSSVLMAEGDVIPIANQPVVTSEACAPSKTVHDRTQETSSDILPAPSISIVEAFVSESQDTLPCAGPIEGDSDAAHVVLDGGICQEKSSAATLVESCSIESLKEKNVSAERTPKVMAVARTTKANQGAEKVSKKNDKASKVQGDSAVDAAALGTNNQDAPRDGASQVSNTKIDANQNIKRPAAAKRARGNRNTNDAAKQEVSAKEALDGDRTEVDASLQRQIVTAKRAKVQSHRSSRKRSVSRSQSPQPSKLAIGERKLRRRVSATQDEPIWIGVVQDELREKKTEELLANSNKASAPVHKPAALFEIQAYPSIEDVPHVSMPQARLSLDIHAKALLVPVAGSLLPFHVRTIKSMNVFAEAGVHAKMGDDADEEFICMSGKSLSTAVASSTSRAICSAGADADGAIGRDDAANCEHPRGEEQCVLPDVTSKAFLLRVVFTSPGQGQSDDDYPALNGSRVYIRNLTFRSRSRENFDTLVRGFREICKSVEAENVTVNEVQPNALVVATPKEGSSTGANSPQKALVLVEDCPSLHDLQLRPRLRSSSGPAGHKYTNCTLQAHANGFRVVISKSDAGAVVAEPLDVLYSQVKHATYESCEEDTTKAILHLHLEKPIQSFAIEAVWDLQFTAAPLHSISQTFRAKGVARDGDTAAMRAAEKEAERQNREGLNAQFQAFVLKVQRIESCQLVFDTPRRSSCFLGKVSKARSRSLYTCSRALVGLQDWPPFCLPFEDIDIAVLERWSVESSARARDFDLVFVKRHLNWKDTVRINGISSACVNDIRRWLTEDVRVPCYAVQSNLWWDKILRTIATNPVSFANTGGWDWFLEERQDARATKPQGRVASVAEHDGETSSDSETVKASNTAADHRSRQRQGHEAEKIRDCKPGLGNDAEVINGLGVSLPTDEMQDVQGKAADDIAQGPS
eukprot:TRINITY_DN6618_c0_g1_i1.p1 TRINITY_DN6618_c0_g1~~TRINITY_DN6618_c0_g1_i1.p1  ORF type:complete len:1746 (-),score=308.35 TRINITY_DN6618_c0_g1_i1:324-5561(-)